MAILDEPHHAHAAVRHPHLGPALPHRHHKSHQPLRKADHIRDRNDHHDAKRKSETCTKCGKRIHLIMQSHHTATCRPVPSNSYHDRNYTKSLHHRKTSPATVNVKNAASQVDHRTEHHSVSGSYTDRCY
ncbi:hypothetical protein RvY_18845 [Ramazzottius varieornatus]|uniref:Uncharacterized protein n=1 Tax=Ramazzottius varieornatus TaxID=947166 RepID=A0A1D1W7H6_RAMVA|nr:hypothetical protein RvY_18845 [Ramazzottius varieornatus]